MRQGIRLKKNSCKKKTTKKRGLPGKTSSAPESSVFEHEINGLNRFEETPYPNGPLCTLAHSKPASWDNLPAPFLASVFDKLQMRELASCACVCRKWRCESNEDPRWAKFWSEQVNDHSGVHGLWRWARAHGGYREQLRARSLVQNADDVSAKVYPLSRSDGAVNEVLFFDSEEQRVVTIHVQKKPQQSIRLQGATVKVWNAASLSSQRPLLVVHDVIKHFQLGDGKLFVWRIRNDAVIVTDLSHITADTAGRRWAEHPSLQASLIDPESSSIRDTPLESNLGRGFTPFEWMDLGPNCIACAMVLPDEHRAGVKLFNLVTGQCFRESYCDAPGLEAIPLFHDTDITMMLSRNSEVGNYVLATCCLFASRVYRWCLHDSWFAVGEKSIRNASLAGHEGGIYAESSTNHGIDGSSLIEQPHGDSRPARQESHVLEMVYTTPGHEPIVDLSISSTNQKIYVVCMEHIYILGTDGILQQQIRASEWRGLAPGSPEEIGGTDVGAFSWPLPCSSKTAFYVDVTNSLFLADFKQTNACDAPPAKYSREPGVLPSYDRHPSRGPDGDVAGYYSIQSHVDLRPPPSSAMPNTLSGRNTRPSRYENVIVEYSQCGSVLFTGADASCATVARLLHREKQRKTYLAGLGPNSAPKSLSSLKNGSRKEIQAGSGSSSNQGLPKRALICIDVKTGARFKTFPIEGVLEAVHSAGHILIAAVADLETYPQGHMGALVIIDFAGT